MQGKPPGLEADADILHGGVHYQTVAVSVMGVANHSGVFLPLRMVGRKREWHCSALIVEITRCAAYLARHLGASLDGGAGEEEARFGGCKNRFHCLLCPTHRLQERCGLLRFIHSWESFCASATSGCPVAIFCNSSSFRSSSAANLSAPPCCLTASSTNSRSAHFFVTMSAFRHLRNVCSPFSAYPSPSCWKHVQG